MGTMKNIADNMRGSLIPELFALRRVPMRCRQILPLAIMKQYQCIVVGSAPGVLTVAITDRQNTSVIESLREFTGQAIFPVLIDPNRMHLLIQRIERYEQSRSAFYSRTGKHTKETGYYRHTTLRLQVNSMVVLLSNLKIKSL